MSFNVGETVTLKELTPLKALTHQFAGALNQVSGLTATVVGGPKTVKISDFRSYNEVYILKVCPNGNDPAKVALVRVAPGADRCKTIDLPAEFLSKSANGGRRRKTRKGGKRRKTRTLRRKLRRS